MARRYDSRTTIFSPEGRLYQVEYAIEAISHAGTCLGILAKDGIVLAAEKRNTNKLLDESQFSEKIYKLHENLVCSMAGITADANVLTNELRMIAQRYLLQYGEPIPCEGLVSWLCDIKHAYTQYGGKRPFGVSILYMGWDKHYGYQLYQSDPSGNYSGWKATCIGHNSAAAVSSLETDYKEDMETKDALALAIKTLAKTLDTTKLTIDKVEMATLTRVDGRTVTRVLPASEVESLIKDHEKAEAEAAAQKKEKQASIPRFTLLFMMIQTSLISLALLAFAHSATLRNGVEIPTYATVCHRNDPEIDDCLRSSIQSTIHKIAKKGIKGVGLAGLDPLVIEEISGGFKGPGYDFNHQLRDMSIRGLGKIKILATRSDLSDPEDLSLELDFVIPDMRIRGSYKLEGLVATVKAGGRGPFTSNSTDIRGTARVSAHLIEEEGVQYMKVHKVEMAPSIGTTKFYFDNIIDGNQELTEAANVFFNNLWLPAYEGMLPYMVDMFDKVFKRIINQAIVKIPYDQLIPE